MIGRLAVVRENFGSGSASGPLEGATPSRRIAVHWMREICGLESLVKKMMWPLALARKIFWNWDGAACGGVENCLKQPACSGTENILKQTACAAAENFLKQTACAAAENFLKQLACAAVENFLKQGWGRLRRCGKFFKTTPPFECATPPLMLNIWTALNWPDTSAKPDKRECLGTHLRGRVMVPLYSSLSLPL